MEQVFFDENGKKRVYTLEKNNKINHGEYGTVYRVNADECIKYYYSFSYLTGEEIMKIIRDMDLDNMYKIHEFLYNNYSFFSGYTMKFYEDIGTDLLIMPMEYLIESFLTICKTTGKISKENIVMNDTNPKNTIITKDGIIIIDIDQYKFANAAFFGDNLFQYNKESVYFLFAELLLRDIQRYHKDYDTDRFFRPLLKIFNKNNSPKEICKKLVKYKYPIDMIGIK